WDISDLDSPQLLGFYAGSTAAIDHNLYIKDGYAYEANYRAGLQILDLSGMASARLSQVGYFDIYPANNNANFNGAWSVYPYFASGVVIISGIEQGLFIVRPHLPTPCYDFNGSGTVDIGDITLVTAAWGTDNTLYDFNGNGTVDVDDIQTIALTWENAC
ncbi:MAG: choice-of-anchor B family protein, partial [Anaerolineae bacterium]|nr:choice-of-anchor B family protein [Anaerolineae bacterium]